MAQEQTAYSGSGTVEVLLNVIDPSTGDHTTATINTTTTRIDGFSTVPTVTQIGTGGIYKLTFSSITPAPTEGDRLVVKVNGQLTGAASPFTEYGVPVKIIADNTSTFDAASDQVTVATNNDKAGYSISGTKTTLDALNDVAATDIVSNGAITTLSGAVVNVDTVDVTTTNSDMRGTDGANTVAPDNASIAAILVDTGTDIPASITALNDLSSTDITNAVWDASIASHNVAGSFGRGLRQIKEGLVSIDGSVDDLSATTTSFVSDLASAVDDFYNDQTIHFISGSLTGQSRVIVDYNGTTKAITVDQALTSAPANGDEFIVLSSHVHSVAEIVDAVWSEDQSTYTTAGSFGYYLDAQISGVSSGGGDASAANQTTIIGHLTDIKGGTFSGSTDSLEAIRDRGDAAWTTGGGSGIYTLTVTVKDASGNLISGARVNIDGTTNTLASNAQGVVIFNLDAGSYTLVTSPPSGYQTPTNVSVTISNDDTAEIVLTAISDAGESGWLG